MLLARLLQVPCRRQPCVVGAEVVVAGQRLPLVRDALAPVDQRAQSLELEVQGRAVGAHALDRLEGAPHLVVRLDLGLAQETGEQLGEALRPRRDLAVGLAGLQEARDLREVLPRSEQALRDSAAVAAHVEDLTRPERLPELATVRGPAGVRVPDHEGHAREITRGEEAPLLRAGVGRGHEDPDAQRQHLGWSLVAPSVQLEADVRHGAIGALVAALDVVAQHDTGQVAPRSSPAGDPRGGVELDLPVSRQRAVDRVQERRLP